MALSENKTPSHSPWLKFGSGTGERIKSDVQTLSTDTGEDVAIHNLGTQPRFRDF